MSKSTLFKLLFASIFFISPIFSSATHYMGSHLRIECLGGCTYRLWHTAYSDCGSGLLENPTVTTIVGDSAACQQPIPLNNWTLADSMTITPSCASVASACNGPGGIFPGVWEAHYYRDYDFCNVDCEQYTIQYGNCCRNGSVQNIALNSPMANFAFQIDLVHTPCNQSPLFNFPQHPFLNDLQPTVFNLGVTDPDGDSLSYHLGPCLAQPTNPVSYNPGFSPLQPLGSNWSVTLDSTSGDIVFLPTPGGQIVATVCIYVREYRNGVMIGEYMKDFQVVVLSAMAITNDLPHLDSITNISGCIADGFDVYACAGQSLCFDLSISDSDTADTHTFWWFDGISGATFSDAANAAAQDTITGMQPTAEFCWTPTQPGTYTFYVRARDNACPLIGATSRQIRIHVGTPGPARTVSDSAGVFTVNPAGIMYQWQNTAFGPIPGATMQSYNTMGVPGTYWCVVTDDFGCEYISDSMMVIAPGILDPDHGRLQVWPNPSSGRFKVDGGTGDAPLEVYDLRGKLIERVALPAYPVELDMRDLPKGMYILQAGPARRKVLLE
ncbi:MAG: T9SS type A sorting domain-containing protein [Bacteroidota bacterium]